VVSVVDAVGRVSLEFVELSGLEEQPASSIAPAAPISNVRASTLALLEVMEKTVLLDPWNSRVPEGMECGHKMGA
jgi:hypothetical protein